MGREGTRTALKLTALVALTIAAVVTPQPGRASVSADGTLVVAISAGAAHTCAVTEAGGAKCWGDGNSGQLGDGIVGGSPIPVDVIGLDVALASISAGDEHTCALTTGGGVKCWGALAIGKRADPPHICFFGFCWPVPADVEGLESGMAAVAAGAFHSCALTSAGGVNCWGMNNAGVLGDGTTGNARIHPVDVCQDYDGVAEECRELLSGVSALAAGSSHNCVIMTVGGVKCWGANGAGELGDGGACGQPCLTPVDVTGLEDDLAAVAAGFGHTCALTTAGGVKCWGKNFSGELGDGTTTNSSVPVDVVGLEGGVAAITAGGAHTCALTTMGDLKCWGNNFFGQLGIAQLGIGGRDPDPHPVPGDVVGLEESVAAVDAGFLYTCAVTTAGGAKCWGNGDFGQLGDGLECRIGGDCSTPVDVVGLGPKPAPTPTATQTPAAPAGTPTATEATPSPSAATSTPTAANSVTLPRTGTGGGDRSSVTPWVIAALAGAGAAAAGCAVLRARRHQVR